MKAVIGTEDDVIGLGLTGIEQRHIRPMNSELDDIESALNDLHQDTTVVYINEALLTKLRYHDKAQQHDVTFIMIPDTEKTPNIDEIERMAKETLGISI